MPASSPSDDAGLNFAPAVDVASVVRAGAADAEDDEVEIPAALTLLPLLEYLWRRAQSVAPISMREVGAPHL